MKLNNIIILSTITNNLLIKLKKIIRYPVMKPTPATTNPMLNPVDSTLVISLALLRYTLEKRKCGKLSSNFNVGGEGGFLGTLWG